MAVVGLLLVTNTWRVNEPPPATRNVSGCIRTDRGTTAESLGSPITARTDADLVALGVVDSNSGLLDIAEAGAPDSQFIIVTYRLEHTFRNTMECRNSVQVTNRVARGRAPTTSDAPLRGSRVLLFARPAQSGDLRYITHAAAPVTVSGTAAIYEVTFDPAAPPTSGPTADAEVATLRAEVPRSGGVSFLTPSSDPEFPVRLTLVNTTSAPIDVPTLEPTQWRLQLNDAQGRLWTYAAAAEIRDFPGVIAPGAQVQTELVAQPEGPETLPPGIYGMEARLETATEPVTSVSTTVAIRCVFACPTGG